MLKIIKGRETRQDDELGMGYWRQKWYGIAWGKNGKFIGFMNPIWVAYDAKTALKNISAALEKELAAVLGL